MTASPRAAPPVIMPDLMRAWSPPARPRIATLAAVVAASGLTASVARADHCQPPLDAPGSDVGLSARVSVEAARFEHALYAGSWSGVAAELGGSWDRWQARAWVGAYQLTRGALVDNGIGDAGFELRATALRLEGGSRVGPTVALTLPTGDAAVGFGMGHPMAMPGLWWSLPGQRIRAGGSLSYARALGDTEGHHHGPGAIIDPMNTSEVMAAGGLGVTLIEQLRAELTASYAHPLVDPGEARATAGLGLVWTTRVLHVGATVQLPLVGDAFQVRGIANVGVDL
jgi:hypothetical protein